MKYIKIIQEFFKRKEKCRHWRLDLKLWEIEYRLLFFTYYCYMVRVGNDITKFYKFRKLPNPKYFVFVKQDPKDFYLRIGRKEFAEKYKSNKYLVPLNVVIDLDRP